MHMSERICFQLHVRPDLLDEYKSRHADVWPEMRAALTDAGWRNYSLFLTDDGTLIGYFECDDLASAQATMAATEVNTRWQSEMGAFFIELGDARPDEGIRAIPEVFHLK
jgi:L-rhamnose mutarotase